MKIFYAFKNVIKFVYNFVHTSVTDFSKVSMFLQETQSLIDVEKNGTAIFKENSFFHTVKQVVVESLSESDLSK